jgi:hypothetical protein
MARYSVDEKYLNAALMTIQQLAMKEVQPIVDALRADAQKIEETSIIAPSNGKSEQIEASA